MALSADRVKEEGVQIPKGAFTINADLFVLDDDTVSWAPTTIPAFPPADDDLEYVIDRIVRPEQIASDFYGNSRLWWVIASANSIRNPLTGFKPGLKLRIPDPSRVRILLEQGESL